MALIAKGTLTLTLTRVQPWNPKQLSLWKSFDNVTAKDNTELDIVVTV